MVTIARIKKASLWMAGKRPLVTSMRTIRVSKIFGLNHMIGQLKNIASPMRIEAKMRNISLVSK